MMKHQENKIAMLLLLILCFCSNVAFSQKMIIWKKDGEKILYDLNLHPKTRFSSDKLIIDTSFGSEIYPLAEIVKYTYDDVLTNIKFVSNNVKVKCLDGQIVVTGLKNGEDILVYSLDGKCLGKVIAHSSVLKIPLPGQPSGMYIVKIGDITYKVLKQ